MLDGANYIGVGPTFPSGTKQFADFAGVELLRKVSADPAAAFAIGASLPRTSAKSIAVGCSRIAVSGADHRQCRPGRRGAEVVAVLGDAGR